MVVEEVFLVGVELAGEDGRVDAHFAEGIVGGGYGGDVHLAVVGKGDEAPVEEVVDRGREEQAVPGGEAFLVGGFAPRFDVAGDEVHGIAHAGDAAFVLVAVNRLLKAPLAPARVDERPAGRLGQADRRLDLALDLLLPLDEHGRLEGRHLGRILPQHGRALHKAEQKRVGEAEHPGRQSARNLRQIRILVPVARGLQRRISLGQKRADLADDVFHPQRPRESREIHIHAPAEGIPQVPHFAKLVGLWAGIARLPGHADRLHLRGSKGKDEVALLDIAQGFIEVIQRTVALAFGAPDIAVLHLVAKRLLMVDPPKPHGRA